MKKIVILILTLLAIINTTLISGVDTRANIFTSTYDLEVYENMELMIYERPVTQYSDLDNNPYWTRFRYHYEVDNTFNKNNRNNVMTLSASEDGVNSFIDLQSTDANSLLRNLFSIRYYDLDGNFITENNISNVTTVAEVGKGININWSVQHDIRQFGTATEKGYSYHVLLEGNVIFDGYILKSPSNTFNNIPRTYDGVILSHSHSKIQFGDVVYNNLTNGTLNDSTKSEQFTYRVGDTIFAHYRLLGSKYLVSGDNSIALSDIRFFDEINGEEIVRLPLDNVVKANCSIYITQDPNTAVGDRCARGLQGFIPMSTNSDAPINMVVPYGFNRVIEFNNIPLYTRNFNYGIMSALVHELVLDGNGFTDVVQARSEPVLLSNNAKPFSAFVNRTSYTPNSYINMNLSAFDSRLHVFFDTYLLESSETVGVQEVKTSDSDYMRNFAYRDEIKVLPLNNTFNYFDSNRGFRYTILHGNEDYIFENGLPSPILTIVEDATFNVGEETENVPIDTRIDNILTRYALFDTVSTQSIMVLLMIIIFMIMAIAKLPSFAYVIVAVAGIILFITIGWMPLWVTIIIGLVIVGILFTSNLKGGVE